MFGGDDVDAPGDAWPSPTAPTVGGAPGPRPNQPVLPPSEARRPPAMMGDTARPAPGSQTWYRTDQERNRSVYRRANPWYRRIARAVIGMAVLGAFAAALFFGAQLVQDFLDRDRLPDAGAEVPEIRATSFLVQSTAPAPVVDGTLTIDVESRAFEFVGGAAGPQAGLQATSPDGVTVYVREGDGAWQPAAGGDAIAGELTRTVGYLADDDSADAILTDRLRGYVDLVEQVDEGRGPDAITRYGLSIDTRAFSTDYPLQWAAFRRDAIPGVEETGALPVTIWIDRSDVLVRVRDEASGWQWQRLTYSSEPFTPIDPAITPDG